MAYLSGYQILSVNQIRSTEGAVMAASARGGRGKGDDITDLAIAPMIARDHYRPRVAADFQGCKPHCFLHFD